MYSGAFRIGAKKVDFFCHISIAPSNIQLDMILIYIDYNKSNPRETFPVDRKKHSQMQHYSMAIYFLPKGISGQEKHLLEWLLDAQT